MLIVLEQSMPVREETIGVAPVSLRVRPHSANKGHLVWGSPVLEMSTLLRELRDGATKFPRTEAVVATTCIHLGMARLIPGTFKAMNHGPGTRPERIGSVNHFAIRMETRKVPTGLTKTFNGLGPRKRINVSQEAMDTTGVRATIHGTITAFREAIRNLIGTH